MERYNRHLNLIGENNFKKIRHAVVLVAGAGGLGSHVLQLLTRFGFGTIHIFDPGILDIPDLNRQIIYDQNDLGTFKVDSAAANLKKINPDVNIISHKLLIENNSSVPEVNVVIDCLDNFQGRLVLENLFFKNGVPIIHGGASQFYGQVTTLIPGETPALSETFGKNFMETADTAPKDIFPPTVMNVASVQVSEAIKLVCDMKENLLTKKLLTIDLLTNCFDIIDLRL